MYTILKRPREKQWAINGLSLSWDRRDRLSHVLMADDLLTHDCLRINRKDAAALIRGIRQGIRAHVAKAIQGAS